MQRIEEIKIRKTEQKNRLIAKIQRKKIKVMRKLLKSRKQNSMKYAPDKFVNFIGINHT